MPLSVEWTTSPLSRQREMKRSTSGRLVTFIRHAMALASSGSAAAHRAGRPAHALHRLKDGLGVSMALTACMLGQRATRHTLAWTLDP